METHAITKGIRLSPYKMGLVAKQVRGMTVEKALPVLQFGKTKAAAQMFKTLSSAVANAENNFGADVDQLYVRTVQVNDGPRLKRIRTRARGRADRIIKRTCHLSVQVSDSREKN